MAIQIKEFKVQIQEYQNFNKDNELKIKKLEEN